jgi:broad specificity phosphatase PhoE
MTQERTLGGLYEGGEYQQAMLEAREEFLAWEKNKKRNRVSTKEKYRAQRLAKLDAMRMLGKL